MKVADLKEQVKHQIDDLPESTFQELYGILQLFLINQTSKTNPIPRQFGVGKGIVRYMADDFDAPLSHLD
jgi:hypothetical protein